MSHHTTFKHAQENFAQLCDEVVSKQDFLTIHRDDDEPVVLMSVRELNGLLETIHLLKSPKNAERLLTSIQRSLSG